MDSARPGNPTNLLSLQEAAQLLGVSISVLIAWNDNNILKPTITQNGHIGYSKEQIEQFLNIRQSLQTHSSQASLSSNFTEATPETKSTPHSSVKAPRINKRTPSLFLSAVILLGAILFYQLSTTPQHSEQTKSSLLTDSRTSSLDFPGEARVSVPEVLNSEVSKKKNLQVEGEGNPPQKLLTKDILSPVRNDPDTNPTQSDIVATLLGQSGSGTSSSGLQVLAQKSTCIACPSKESVNLVFDEEGNLKGDVESSSVLSTVEKIGLGSAISTIGSTTSTSGIHIFMLSFAALSALYLFRHRLAYSTPQSKKASAPISAMTNMDQKALEVTQKTDGTVLLIIEGKAFKISKPELYSESDQFIERLMELAQNGSKEIEFDTNKDGRLKITTPLSRLVTRLGFVGIKRDLFFPRTSKQMVLFRKYLTHRDLHDMNLTPSQILQELTPSN